MTNENYDRLQLAEEIRADNQVPPYTPDDVIIRSIMKCEQRLKMLKPCADFELDPISRGLLKDFVYYDMVHRFEEFMTNYGPDIRSWQLSEEVADASE
jgi:hypothetical protein